MSQRARPLYRTDIRQRTDKPTNSVVLQYVGGRRLDFEGYLYGYPEGTFFAATLSEIPYPAYLEELSAKHSVNIDALVDAPRLRQAVVEALAAQAVLEAPELLGDIAYPDVRWQDWDRRELERRHRIALARVAELARLVENDIKIHAFRVTPQVQMPDVTSLLGPEPMPPRLRLVEPPAALPEPASPCPPVVEDAVAPCEDELDPYAPGSQTVQSAVAAAKAARESELPQRLPKGTRRRLKRMPPAAYIIYGEAVDPRPGIALSLLLRIACL